MEAATATDRIDDLPTESIVIPQRNLNSSATNYRPAEADDKNRAEHIIRLSSLQHNYECVESAAARQRCSVITVVKADGYGHGAIATALHLADSCGADAFAVATLEEAIAIRKAFEQNPPGRWSKQIATTFHPGAQASQLNGASIVSEISYESHTRSSHGTSVTSYQQHVAAARCKRPAHIRILVLGPPIGFPRCYNDYFHYGIEVMISGPEVATALVAWVANEKERKHTQVEKAAMESKERALLQTKSSLPVFNAARRNDTPNAGETSPLPLTLSERPARPLVIAESSEPAPNRKVLPHPSSTLGNVSGRDLAREVRTILMTQKAATDAAEHSQEMQGMSPALSRDTSTLPSNAGSSENSVTDSNSSLVAQPHAKLPQQHAISTMSAPLQLKQAFSGIEAAAKLSRVREMTATKSTLVSTTKSSTTSVRLIGNGSDGSCNFPQTSSGSVLPVSAVRKRLRWHALVDTGMGRLGFKTKNVEDSSDERDTVAILEELVNAEIHSKAPIEFFGMCTHMADANSPNSTYTQTQMDNFVSLLQRIRAAGISVPTVSADNSAALLTTSLTHFNPELILSQPNAHSRGFVRTGGAIFGQRPAFTQLKAVSTLIASVRHVNVITEGDSVGYDRAYVAPYDIRIATLTVGFADGLPRDLGNGRGKVSINGAAFPIVGNVCMDMIMVALNRAKDPDGEGSTVVVGDTAVLWGPFEDDQGDGLVRLQDVANSLKTTQSALTCGLSVRISRVYV